jgi:hypothetical protein
MTLTDLLDWRKLAEFMDWPFKDEERINPRYAYQREHVTAEEATRENWSAYLRQINPPKPTQTHANFIRECAREAFGVKGRTADEVRQKLLALRPDLFTPVEAVAL